MHKITFRLADFNDADIYFRWLNDPITRINSLSSDFVTWEHHVEWFKEKIKDSNFTFYIFQNHNFEFIGQVRFEKINSSESIISVSVAEEHRRNGYGEQMLKVACINYFDKNPKTTVNAYIKNDNYSSKMIFKKVGFIFSKFSCNNNIKSEQFILNANRKF